MYRPVVVGDVVPVDQLRTTRVVEQLHDLDVVVTLAGGVAGLFRRERTADQVVKNLATEDGQVGDVHAQVLDDRGEPLDLQLATRPPLGVVALRPRVTREGGRVYSSHRFLSR